MSSSEAIKDPQMLSIRILMQGKEVGSIIGKKGEIVKRFREESRAKINISDGSCPERVVTITGSVTQIISAFKLVCEKFEDFLGQTQHHHPSGQRTPITLRLIVPASQCGSLIGKGGAKIKEIRELTGSSIQVATEMLPNSTERAVTVSGAPEAVTQCVYQVCNVMMESPPKGATIPYRPKPPTAGGPVILAGGQAYTIQGNYAVPSAPDISKLSASPLAGILQLGSIASASPALSPTGGPLDISALAALAGSQLRAPSNHGPGTQTHEMTVPNELIGCIIGKGGTKIAEIRQITGAMITISKYDDASDEASKQDRTITIKGNPDQVALAQYLINTSQELHKAQLDMNKTPGLNASSIPLAQLLKNPQALNALSSLTGMQSLSSLSTLLAPDSSHQGISAAVAIAAQRQKAYQSKLRASSTTTPSNPPSANGSPKEKRSKFTPY